MYNNGMLKFYIGDVRRSESLLEAMTGVVCPPEDAADLAEAVRPQVESILEAPRAAMGQTGLWAVSTVYSRATSGKRYPDLFQELVAKELSL